jgi:hypothetical protein
MASLSSIATHSSGSMDGHSPFYKEGMENIKQFDLVIHIATALLLKKKKKERGQHSS